MQFSLVWKIVRNQEGNSKKKTKNIEKHSRQYNNRNTKLTIQLRR